MKKIFILTIVFSITQVVHSQILSYGLKAGSNYTYWHQDGGASSIDDLYDTTTNTEYGFEIGLVARQLLSKNTSLNEEFIYTTRTSSVRFKQSGDRISTMKNEFITVPIFISYNAFKKFNLDAGVQYSRIIKHTSLAGLPQGNIDNLNLGSAILGLSYDLTKKFNINVRYNHTFTGIDKQALSFIAFTIGDGTTLSPRSLNLAVSYYFD